MTQKTSKIPKFASYEEEAAFWDTHDFAEFREETKRVKVELAKDAFKQPLSEILPVRFDKSDAEIIRSEASTLGLSPTTLIRMWVKERLSSRLLSSI